MHIFAPADRNYVNFAFTGAADNHLARSVTERYLTPKERKQLDKNLRSRTVRTGHGVAVVTVAIEHLEPIYDEMATIVSRCLSQVMGNIVSLQAIRQEAELQGDLAQLGQFLYPSVVESSEPAAS